MVLYFIRKVHVFMQFSEKEYALLINFFSYRRNRTSFHQNPGQAEQLTYRETNSTQQKVFAIEDQHQRS